MDFYTVDRRNSLSAGTICNLIVYSDIQPAALQNHVNTMFPEGVSTHGEQYFLKNESHSTVISPMLEVVFEYVRRAKYPHLPSRFQCMFAVNSIEAANSFKSKYGSEFSPIYRVKSEIAIKADMNLLTAQTVLVTSYFGNLYWSGEVHPEKEPFWEYLLPYPVTVCERIA